MARAGIKSDRDMRAIAAAAAVSALTLAVQNPPVADRRPLRSSVELTVVTATVRDADGKLVAGLPRAAFEIYEDGDPQPISQFTNERVPVGLGLLLDISDSMFGRRIVDARGAVERFLLELLQPSDAFFVMAFNHEPRMLTQWTNEPSTVREALNAIKPWGGTAIYDAIIRAEPMLDARTRERAALVVISDGADTASDASLRDVRSAVLRTDAFIYAVAIDSTDHRPINTRVNPEALREITNQSGGTTEVVHDSGDLDEATMRIAEELNSQYVLGYSPPHGADGRYHSIRVRVTNTAFRVRARNGYVAAPRP
jgi:Ca-activated chloride channel homolog